MFWKYFLFEAKLLLHNRKNLFLGFSLLLFFPVFFIYNSQTEPETLKDLKKTEASMIKSTLNQFPDTQKDTPEGAEIHDSLLKQSSLVNFQIFYLRSDETREEYIENGLLLTQLRLRAHELDNMGIPKHLILSKEEILIEDTLLRYIQKHELPLQPDPFTASRYLVVALNTLSGLLFYFFAIVSGSEMLVYEQRHRTVVNGFPISFMKKINSKISVHFLQIGTFLVIGFLFGGIFASRKSGVGDFSYPILIYKNGGFEAISTTRYLLYVFLAMALITIMLLYISVLLNLIFKNAYANVLIGLGVFLLPDLLRTMGVNSTLLQPIKYVEFSNVLSGALAVQLGNSQIDYWHSIIWLLILSLLMIAIIYAKSKFEYIGKIKEPKK